MVTSGWMNIPGSFSPGFFSRSLRLSSCALRCCRGQLSSSISSFSPPSLPSALRASSPVLHLQLETLRAFFRALQLHFSLRIHLLLAILLTLLFWWYSVNRFRFPPSVLPFITSLHLFPLSVIRDLPRFFQIPAAPVLSRNPSFACYFSWSVPQLWIGSEEEGRVFNCRSGRHFGLRRGPEGRVRRALELRGFGLVERA